MRAYRLETEGMLDPRWVAALRAEPCTTVVDNNGTVWTWGQRLHFTDEKLPAGTKIVVSLGRNITCTTVEDMERAKYLADMERQLLKTRDRQIRNVYRGYASQRNSLLHLPVAWETGIKAVLSGLSEGSWGDGSNRATVIHIRLLDDLSDGRLRRKKGDFLCMAQGGDNGKDYVTETTWAYDGDGQQYQPAVSCKKCLSLTARWRQRG